VSREDAPVPLEDHVQRTHGFTALETKMSQRCRSISFARSSLSRTSWLTVS